MRGFITKRIPDFNHVLLVESGSRHLLENFLPTLYRNHPAMHADVVTCYGGAPTALDQSRGEVFNTNDYSGNDERRQLIAKLAAGNYDILGIICSAEPILAKWKWAITARVPAKVFVLNENGDLFWIDRGHWANIRQFIAYRSGLTGAGAVRTIARVLLFPFTLLYLIFYAATIHLRRKLRTL